MVGRNEHTLDNYACIIRRKKPQVHHIILRNSGAPAARRATKQSPILIMQGKDKGNP